jgi:threonine/homoserine/homoserine lactone efflux protein
MFLLHEGMPLHPLGVALCFFIFALLAVSTLISTLKKGNKPMAGLMVVSVAFLVYAGIIAIQVPAQ